MHAKLTVEQLTSALDGLATSEERVAGTRALLAFAGVLPSRLDPKRELVLARELLHGIAVARHAGLDGAALEERAAAVLADALGVATVLESGHKCPKVRFGRTELQMPIITCGGMRLQQSWGRNDSPPKPESADQVDAAVQRGFVATLRAALKAGINHFETARGYGCSEIQFGAALKELLAAGDVTREQFILQTKVVPFASLDKFKSTLDASFEALGVDANLGGYVDLFAFHGLNRLDQLDAILENGLLEHVEALRAAGKIRHIGFSTHAQTDVILKAINTGKFDYVNLHFHFVGSYTASGGTGSEGNAACLDAAAAHDMGMFIISPYDKGGALYKPSKTLAREAVPCPAR